MKAYRFSVSLLVALQLASCQENVPNGDGTESVHELAAREHIVVSDLSEMEDFVCTPNCLGRICGPDGCGGSCGACDSGEFCSDAGFCSPLCIEDCEGKKCGSNGCGGECGTCEQWPNSYCSDEGQCACLTDCEVKDCGNDGCGGSCGDCLPDLTCKNGLCVSACTPDCKGKECGTDGCEGSCGECPDELYCSDGVCVDNCTPNCSGKECGPDGCGGSCGTCDQGTECAIGQCVASYCEGYSGNSACCTSSDTCSFADNGICDCGGKCEWDVSDCESGGSGALCEPCDDGSSCQQAYVCAYYLSYPSSIPFCVPQCNNSNDCPEGFYCYQGESSGFCWVESQSSHTGCYEGDAWLIDDTCGTGLELLESCPDGYECDDGECISIGPVCGSGVCEPGENKCNCPQDCGNPCAGKECGPDGCGGQCGSCSGSEVCQDGQCASICAGVDCDDGNACTVDSCDPDSGCVYTAVDCDDGNSCTDDICYSATGCLHVPNSAPCMDDGNPCTEDMCSDGTCEHNSKDDGTVCGNGTCQDGVCSEYQCNPNSLCCTSNGMYVPYGQTGPGCSGSCKQCNDSGSCVNKSNGTTCGGGICEDGECDEWECVPNSTCCTSNGTYVPYGQTSSGCTGSCKQCNGDGSCVNKSNGTSCIGGTCQNGICDPFECTPNSTCCTPNGTHVPYGQTGSGCTSSCKQCNGGGSCVNKTNGTSCSGGTCLNGLCDPFECTPNSTCCTSNGTHVPYGQTGSGCTGSCKQCNGGGSCVNKTNGTSCSGGTCQNGVCEAECTSNFDCDWPCGWCNGGDCEVLDYTDSYETNNSYNNASELGYINETSGWFDDGNPQQASVFPGGDVDVYWFEVEDTGIIPGVPRPAVSIESFLVGNMSLLDICIFYECAGGGDNTLEEYSCPYGWESTWNGLSGCCSQSTSTGAFGYVRIDDINCSNYWEDGKAFVVVGAVGASYYTCSETGYDFKWGED